MASTSRTSTPAGSGACSRQRSSLSGRPCCSAPGSSRRSSCRASPATGSRRRSRSRTSGSRSREGDYFEAVSSPSPFLHYWSLSVEEQFYLVWPVTLLLAFRLGRRRSVIGAVILAIGIASLAAAILLTDIAASWAFYSLPTRAWQLAAGGLLAVAALAPLPLPRRRDGARERSPGPGSRRSSLGSMLLDESLAYPGAWALVPTLGAAALIAGGDRALSPGLLLRTAPMRFLGRISYALYLWHWPLLVLPVVALGGGAGARARASRSSVSRSRVATLSTVLVEEPIRRGVGTGDGPTPGGRRRRPRHGAPAERRRRRRHDRLRHRCRDRGIAARGDGRADEARPSRDGPTKVARSSSSPRTRSSRWARSSMTGPRPGRRRRPDPAPSTSPPAGAGATSHRRASRRSEPHGITDAAATDRTRRAAGGLADGRVGRGARAAGHPRRPRAPAARHPAPDAAPAAAAAGPPRATGHPPARRRQAERLGCARGRGAPPAQRLPPRRGGHRAADVRVGGDAGVARSSRSSATRTRRTGIRPCARSRTRSAGGS